MFSVSVAQTPEESAHNIIIGYGSVLAKITEDDEVLWILPGRQPTADRDVAQRYAEKLDRLYRANARRLAKAAASLL